MTEHHYNPDPHAHPGLHVIAIVEGVKGTLALLAASGLELIGPAPLQRWINALIAHFQLDPEHGAMAWLAHAINPDAVHLAAAVAALYGIVHLVEGWGLWRARAWASWLGCIGSAAYLPLDVYALYHHPGWHTWALLVVNLVIVWVLWRDIRRRRSI